MVRPSGISESDASCPFPFGSSARYFWPSKVFIRIEAAVCGPNAASALILKSTLTCEPSSSIPVTLPTRTPAIRTSSSLRMPPASVNAAW